MTYDDELDERERQSYGAAWANDYPAPRSSYPTHGRHTLPPADVRGDPPALADEPHLAPGESLFFG